MLIQRLVLLTNLHSLMFASNPYRYVSYYSYYYYSYYYSYYYYSVTNLSLLSLFVLSLFALSLFVLSLFVLSYLYLCYICIGAIYEFVFVQGAQRAPIWGPEGPPFGGQRPPALCRS